MANEPTLTVAIFASDKGPGDAERASVMSSAGAYFARRGARLVALSEAGTLPLPAITSARAAGGEVEIFTDDHFAAPKALASVPLVRIADRDQRLRKLSERAACYVVLPGSLATITSLFKSTLGLEISKPVVFLNHHHSFDVLRGFTTDVLTFGRPGTDRNFQFADNVEDLWNKVAKVTGHRG